MSSLTERYIDAAIENVPDRERAEVAADVRGAIDEMIGQRIEDGESEQQAVRSALEELGDPRSLAQSYQDMPRYLIGPGWYPLYIVLLKRVLPVALVLVAAIAMISTTALDDSGLYAIIESGLEAVIDIGLQILFWVTLGFVIAERTMGSTPDFGEDKLWTVDDLPDEPAPREVGLGETVGTILTLLVFGGLVIIQQTRGVGFFIFGDDAPDWRGIALVNPDLGTGWAIGFAALILLSITFAIAGYLRRTWDMRMVMLTAVDSALWIAYIVALAVSEPIMNPEFADRIGEGDGSWWRTGNQANQIIAIAIIAYSVWEVWEAWQRYRANRHTARIATSIG